MDGPTWIATRWHSTDRRFEVWHNSPNNFALWMGGNCLGTFRNIQTAKRAAKDYLLGVPLRRKSA